MFESLFSILSVHGLLVRSPGFLSPSCILSSKKHWGFKQDRKNEDASLVGSRNKPIFRQTSLIPLYDVSSIGLSIIAFCSHQPGNISARVSWKRVKICSPLKWKGSWPHTSCQTHQNFTQECEAKVCVCWNTAFIWHVLLYVTL